MPKLKAKNKTEFIRRQPKDVPAGEIVKKAIAAGFKNAHVRDVYRVRTLENRANGVPPKSAGGGRHVDLAAVVIPRDSMRKILIDAVLEHGLANVEKELAVIRAKLLEAAGR